MTVVGRDPFATNFLLATPNPRVLLVEIPPVRGVKQTEIDGGRHFQVAGLENGGPRPVSLCERPPPCT